MKDLKLLLIIVILYGLVAACAGSTYSYKKNADGSAEVLVKSKNEIDSMRMYINRETGELEVDIGGMTKKSDVEAVGAIIKDVVSAANPAGG